MREERENPTFCTFCGKHQDYVEILLEAHSHRAFICDECIEVASARLAQKRAAAGIPK